MARMLSRRLFSTLLLIVLAPAAVAEDHPRVELQTSLGNIVLELDPQQAPGTVANFLEYVDEGFYDGAVFHRVIPGFMIQGGGFTTGLERKPAHDPIANEADNGLPNNTGTIAMARTGDPHSATAQFFINLADNDFLNHRNKGQGWGYCVFGRVVEGADTVTRIGAVRTGAAGQFAKDVPVEPVIITSARRVVSVEQAN